MKYRTYKKSYKINLYLFLIVALLVAFNYLYRQYKSRSTNNSETTDYVIKKDTFDFLPTSTTGQIVHHKFFDLSYNEKYENAEWVAYVLTKNQVSKAQRKRPYFIRDPKVKTRSASYKNYYPYGYEKGHLVPAADRRFSEEAFDETFYTSNVSPMDHDFNAGIWNDLEKQVRYWAKRYGKLYIVAGGVLKPGLERISPEKIAVPDEFYKVILDYNPKHPKMIGFLIKHHDTLVSPKIFTVPVDSIEKLTGIDFFPALPDSLENKLESENKPNEWKFVRFDRH